MCRPPEDVVVQTWSNKVKKSREGTDFNTVAIFGPLESQQRHSLLQFLLTQRTHFSVCRGTISLNTQTRTLLVVGKNAINNFSRNTGVYRGHLANVIMGNVEEWMNIIPVYINRLLRTLDLQTWERGDIAKSWLWRNIPDSHPSLFLAISEILDKFPNFSVSFFWL